MSLEHPNLAVLWNRSFKAPCKMASRDSSKVYRTDFHSNHIKVFFGGAGGEGAENSLHYQVIIFFSNVLSQQNKVLLKGVHKEDLIL